MKLSQSFFKTSKDVPSDESSVNAKVLIKAAYIHKTMAGVYSLLPLGLRVQNNIEAIIRKHLNGVGGQEVKFNSLHPKEFWEKSKRWDAVDILFKLNSQTNTEYALACSHEEQAVPVVSSYIHSYKDIPSYNPSTGSYPVCVYQIQTKFRDELRAKAGMLRLREFTMKDMYDFHTNTESQDAYYDIVKDAYTAIYTELGITSYAVQASGGIFTSNISHEFQAECDSGEDYTFIDPRDTNNSWNSEMAPCKAQIVDYTNEDEQERQDVHLEGVIGVEALIKEFGIEKTRSTKTLLYEDAYGNIVLACVRSDRAISEDKLQHICGKIITPAKPETIEKVFGCAPGYAGIVNIPEGVEVYLDESIEKLKNFETGTNKTGYHSINVCFGRDVEIPTQFYDVKEAVDGDFIPGTELQWKVVKTSEIGNIFKLDDKYTKAFGVTYTDENNAQKVPLMNCYGIGVSRCLGIIAHTYSDEKGLKWPESVAPFKYHLVSIGDKDEEINAKIMEAARSWYTSHPDQVLWDDRESARFGQKMGDAELMGCPYIVVISKRSLENGGYEVTNRHTGKSEIVTL